MNVLNNFYNNKKILITGHTGFKGLWLTTILSIFGAKIIGLSLNDKNKKKMGKKNYVRLSYLICSIIFRFLVSDKKSNS